MSKSFRINNKCFELGRESIKLGNILVSGPYSEYREMILEAILGDSLANNGSAIVFQNGNAMKLNNYIKELTRYTTGCSTSLLYDLANNDYSSGGIDLLKGLSNGERADIIIEFVESFNSEIKNESLEFFRMHLSNVVDVLDILNDPYTVLSFENLKYFTAEWLKTKAKVLLKKKLINQARADDIEYYADSYVPMHKSYEYEYKDFCNQIEKNSVAQTLSNGISVEDMLNDCCLSVISLDFLRREKLSKAIMKTLMKMMIYWMPRVVSCSSVVFEDLDDQEIPEIKDFMANCISSDRVTVVMTVNNLTKFSETWDPLSYSDTYFVYQQVKPDNRALWAQMSGTYMSNQKSLTYSNPLGSSIGADLVANVIGLKTTRDHTISKVEKTFLEEQDFSSLKVNECYFMSRKNIIRSGRRGPERMYFVKLSI